MVARDALLSTQQVARHALKRWQNEGTSRLLHALSLTLWSRPPRRGRSTGRRKAPYQPPYRRRIVRQGKGSPRDGRGQPSSTAAAEKDNSPRRPRPWLARNQLDGG